MKKLSIIATGLLSLGCLCAGDSEAANTMDWQSKLSGNVGMEFESEHINRGRKEISGRAFVPSAEVSYQLFDAARAYVGTEASLRMKDAGSNDVAPYVGCMYDINDMFTVDAGYTHHFYNEDGESYDGSELYLGMLADIMFSPSVYAEYNFKTEEFNLVGTVGYNFDLSQYAISCLGIDLGAKLGYDRCNKPGGIDYNAQMGKKDYMYYGLNADLIYSITDSAKARAGVAYEGNSAKKATWVNGNHARNIIWFNASVDCAF